MGETITTTHKKKGVGHLKETIHVFLQHTSMVCTYCFLCCMQFPGNSMGKRQMASPPKAKQNTTRRYKAM